MAREENQKLKILYVAKFFLENSDPDHLVTTNDIIDYLKEECGIESLIIVLSKCVPFCVYHFQDGIALLNGRCTISVQVNMESCEHKKRGKVIPSLSKSP